ncbi:MAG: phosphate ABC transporter permease PstA [Gammaproteobacteria bacterium]|nr:phosphate ABC transporter permease PstA [Gammaproteobacteria bacterium]MYF38623.1 phosphate ABC transporter permease PstA [Gammaproteobacteria bacterium]
MNLGVWFKSGEPWIWLTATAVGTSIVAVLGLIGIIAVKGLAHFWPSDVVTIDYENELGAQTIAGEIVQRERVPREQFEESGADQSIDVKGDPVRWMLKSGNRKVNAPDFRWIYEHTITQQQKQRNLIVFERLEWGNAYGSILELREQGSVVPSENSWKELRKRIKRVVRLRREAQSIQSGSIDRINYKLEKLRLRQRGRELRGNFETADIDEQRMNLNEEYVLHERELNDINAQLDRDDVVIAIAGGTESVIPLKSIVRAWQPNDMNVFTKFGHYCASIWAFLSEGSREANTEGGVFPALFGTVLMVMLMSILVTPFGVVAALYLREYARQGLIVRLIRIAVNNLAGVPSIVYGVFGLGFFVYIIGGGIDWIFFQSAHPAPTFGTPGLIWASLTLALLTVPVVIVSTEEGLTRIPKALREGSLALGATKAETLFKVVLPMASPSILTGIILAIARAAGEVAPLMLVGVVKLAPTLAIDGNFPFLHLDRKFMHLGFHIYDVGFQSPNVDAARPLVFATALLLVLIVIVLNLTAITLRNRLEARYREALN